MSEIEEVYTIPEPTLQQQLQALEREVQHVTEQLTVEHAQIAYWKQRALTAEHVLDTIQRGLGRTPRKPGPSGKAHASESSLESPDALDALL